MPAMRKSPRPAVPCHVPLPSCRGWLAAGWVLWGKPCSVVQRHQRGPVQSQTERGHQRLPGADGLFGTCMDRAVCHSRGVLPPTARGLARTQTSVRTTSMVAFVFPSGIFAYAAAWVSWQWQAALRASRPRWVCWLRGAIPLTWHMIHPDAMGWVPTSHGSSSPCPSQTSFVGREAPSPVASPVGQALACRAGPPSMVSWHGSSGSGPTPSPSDSRRLPSPLSLLSGDEGRVTCFA